MAEIVSHNRHPKIDYTGRDYMAILESMREIIREEFPEWSDHESEADFGNVLLQLFAHMGDMLNYYIDRAANESFLGTAQRRESLIQHLRLIGYRLSTATPASTSLVLFIPETQTETITIRKGDAFATKSFTNQPSIRFEYTGDVPLEINCAELPTVPRQPVAGQQIPEQYRRYAGKKYYGRLLRRPAAEQRLLPAGLPVEEGLLIRNELLSIADGSPDQRYRLAHGPLILRSLGSAQTVNRDIEIITVGGAMNGEIESWNLQETLAFSLRNQRHFIIEIDADDQATVLFGDGVFGYAPPKGAQVRATYRIGGGLRGNVAAHTIETIVDAPHLALIGATVTNPQPATGGDDRESADHAVRHAPGVFRSQQRAVTAGDYEALARDFKGVGKVKAKADNWNRVTLVVAPAGGGLVSDLLRNNLIAYFEDKRPVTTYIEIEDAVEVTIYVAAEIEIERYYNQAEVEERARTAARRILAFEAVDFAQTIYLSKFYEALEAVEGLKSVYIRWFSRRSLPQTQPSANEEYIEEDGRIQLGTLEIPVPAIRVITRAPRRD